MDDEEERRTYCISSRTNQTKNIHGHRYCFEYERNRPVSILALPVANHFLVYCVQNVCNSIWFFCFAKEVLCSYSSLCIVLSARGQLVYLLFRTSAIAYWLIIDNIG